MINYLRRKIDAIYQIIVHTHVEHMVASSKLLIFIFNIYSSLYNKMMRNLFNFFHDIDSVETPPVAPPAETPMEIPTESPIEVSRKLPKVDATSMEILNVFRNQTTQISLNFDTSVINILDNETTPIIMMPNAKDFQIKYIVILSDEIGNPDETFNDKNFIIRTENKDFTFNLKNEFIGELGYEIIFMYSGSWKCFCNLQSSKAELIN